jgi:hypothetical protein
MKLLEWAVRGEGEVNVIDIDNLMFLCASVLVKYYVRVY